jgi:hypothetical protein
VNIPLADYLEDPAPTPSLSASLAHVLLTRSPRHCWTAARRLNPDWKPESSEAMDAGSIAHAMLLEKDHTRIVLIDAPDFRTKVAKEQRDTARAEGKLPVLAHRLGQITTMVIEARRAIERSELAPVFADGQAEQTLLWQEGETWCRSRPDWVSTDYRVAVDYKTTQGSAEPSAFARGAMLAFGYDVQAAFGLRGLQVVHKPRDRSFVFLVQETEPPYACSLVGLSPAFEAFAEQKRRAAVALWTACLAQDHWPSYPERVCWMEPPTWAQTQFSERYPPVGDESVEEL